MKFCLTSFGISVSGFPTFGGLATAGPFHRMPPVDMRVVAGKFRPPYSLLLLCEGLAIDKGMFEILQAGLHNPAYDLVAETMTALHADPSLSEAVLPQRVAPEIVEQRLGREPDDGPFTQEEIRDAVRIREMLEPYGTLGGRGVRALAPYLTYVNANLIISAHLNMPFHDWDDFQPLYREKFIQIGRRKPPGDPEIEASRALFEVSFPEFAVENTSQLGRV